MDLAFIVAAKLALRFFEFDLVSIITSHPLPQRTVEFAEPVGRSVMRDDVSRVDRLDVELIFHSLPCSRVNDATCERIVNCRLKLKKLPRVLREIEPLTETSLNIAPEPIGVGI